MICHVKDCAGDVTRMEWVPAFEVCIGMCEQHNNLALTEKSDLIIDLSRARKDHASNIADIIAATKMMDSQPVPKHDRQVK